MDFPSTHGYPVCTWGISSVHGNLVYPWGSRLLIENLCDYYYYLLINLSLIFLITPLSSVAVINDLIVTLTSSLSSRRITSLSLNLLRSLTIITYPTATLSSHLYKTRI